MDGMMKEVDLIDDGMDVLMKKVSKDGRKEGWKEGRKGRREGGRIEDEYKGLNAW